MNVVDPPGEYYGRNYYAVYFTDPDGMKLEAHDLGAAAEGSAAGTQAAGQDEAQNGAQEAESALSRFRTPRAAAGICATTALRPRRLAS